MITSSSISNLCLHSNLPYHLLDTPKGSRALSDVRQNIISSIAYLTFLDIAEKLRSDEHVHCCMYSFQVYYDLLLKNRYYRVIYVKNRYYRGYDNQDIVADISSNAFAIMEYDIKLYLWVRTVRHATLSGSCSKAKKYLVSQTRGLCSSLT